MGMQWPAVAGLVILAAACNPALNWRELRPPGAELTVLFPCRPSSQDRQVMFAGRTLKMTLSACEAAGATWAVSTTDVRDPGAVADVVRALVNAAHQNLGAAPGEMTPLDIAVATPNAAAGRFHVVGSLPDGRRVQEQAVVFARGTRVHQLAIVGEVLPQDAVRTFFDSVRAVP